MSGVWGWSEALSAYQGVCVVWFGCGGRVFWPSVLGFTLWRGWLRRLCVSVWFFVACGVWRVRERVGVFCARGFVLIVWVGGVGVSLREFAFACGVSVCCVYACVV